MKKYLFYLILAFVWVSCEKEDTLEPKIDYFNLYTIAPDPNDSVQQLRYEIYTEYGIPVYFSDTVGKYPLTVNVYGDTVYEYELMDLNWEFTNSSEDSRSIEYIFLKDDTEKYNALLFAQKFLENSSPALRPLSMLLVDTLNIMEDASEGYVFNHELHNFRTMVWGGVTLLSEEDQTALIEETCKSLISEKIQNYTYELTQFQVVSQDYYNKSWPTSLPEYTSDCITEYVDDTSDCITEYVDENNPMAYYNTWFGSEYLNITYGMYDGIRHTHEEAVAILNERRDAYCAIVGAWGFVYGYGRMASYTAPSAEDDLNCYLERLLSDNPTAWFERYYSNYPLVMKKYEILYNLIVNELGVKLDNNDEEQEEEI